MISANLEVIWAMSNEISDGVGEYRGKHDRAADETRNGRKFHE